MTAREMKERRELGENEQKTLPSPHSLKFVSFSRPLNHFERVCLQFSGIGSSLEIKIRCIIHKPFASSSGSSAKTNPLPLTSSSVWKKRGQLLTSVFEVLDKVKVWLHSEFHGFSRWTDASLFASRYNQTKSNHHT